MWFRTVSQTFSSLLMYFIKEHEDLLPKNMKKTENLNPKIFKTKNGRMIMQLRCTQCRF